MQLFIIFLTKVLQMVGNLNQNSGAPTWVNTYNRIEEGRRIYISINGSF